MKILVLVMLLFIQSFAAYSVCTGPVKIKKLMPRQDGWVHVVTDSVANMDIMKCGNNSGVGMILNFNDNSGTPEGKQMLYTTLLAALAANMQVNICSNHCDSQHPLFSNLTHLDEVSR